MKLELKTENENHAKSISKVFIVIFRLVLIIILFDIGLKLGIISRNYKIDYNCRLLSIEKSTNNFKKLSKLSKLKTKQRIWDFCRMLV